MKKKQHDDILLKKGNRYDGWYKYRHNRNNNTASAIPASSVLKFGSLNSPTLIFGASLNDKRLEPRVLSPPLMECLQSFLPFSISEENFWLKYSLSRDGASLETLLSKVHGCTWTILAIETTNGHVFGALTGSPWHTSPHYYGSGESFLWKLKTSRILDSDRNASNAGAIDTDLEIYPFTGYDRYVQQCTGGPHPSLIVGGGQWNANGSDNPYENERDGFGLQLDGNLERGKTACCSTFANRALCYSENGRFDVLNVEAWTLTPCVSVSEAVGLESRKIFIDEHNEHNHGS